MAFHTAGTGEVIAKVFIFSPVQATFPAALAGSVCFSRRLIAPFYLHPAAKSSGIQTLPPMNRILACAAALYDNAVEGAGGLCWAAGVIQQLEFGWQLAGTTCYHTTNSVATLLCNTSHVYCNAGTCPWQCNSVACFPTGQPYTV